MVLRARNVDDETKLRAIEALNRPHGPTLETGIVKMLRCREMYLFGEDDEEFHLDMHQAGEEMDLTNTEMDPPDEMNSQAAGNVQMDPTDLSSDGWSNR